MFNFQYTPNAVPLAISGLILILLIFHLYERKTTLAAKPAMVVMVALFIWNIGYMLETLGADLSTKLFWAKIQYFGTLSLPLIFLCFALEFSSYTAWLTKTSLIALQIIPVTILVLVFTNENHRLIWSEWNLQTFQSTNFLHLDYSIAFWVSIIYSYILLVVSTVLIINTIIKRSELYHGQIIVILIAILAPWIGNSVANFGLFPKSIDLTSFGFTITGLAIVWGISRNRLLDIAPIAYEPVFESLSDAAFILDAQNIIVEVNKAGLAAINLSINEVIGHHIRDVFKAQADLLDRFQHTMDTREEISVELNSQIRHYELSISPLVNRQNNTTGRAIVFHDISDRKKAEAAMAEARDQALQANQSKSQFLARISHELRTPLGVIRGYADLLNEPAYGPLTEPQKKAVKEIIESNDRVSDMVSELLDEARLAAGAVQLESRQFSPAHILEDAEGKLSVLAQQKGLRLTTELDPELPAQLIGDPTRISQIVTNFASNSIKFTQKGGVHIKFDLKSNKLWVIEVSDTGPGIPKEAQKEIFEPFRQADKTITRKYGGTGLGLSIVKHLTNLMNGEINIQSEIGVGSTFTVTLPLNSKVPK